MTMALQVFTDLMALLWQHPMLSGLVLVLFTPPFFPILRFFSPLLISTALFMLALFTVGGPQPSTSTATPNLEENWEFRRAADVKVWEDKSVFTTRRRKGDGSSWMDWFQTIAESGYAWAEKKLQNENWKGSALNDDNVSILQEATWAPTPKAGDDNPSSSSAADATNAPTEDINTHVPAAISPSMLFKVDSKLKAELVANAKKSCDVEDLGEGTPTRESTQAQNIKHANSVHHEPLRSLEIPTKTGTGENGSPNTDLDDSSDLERSKRFVRRNSVNASSALSVTSESDWDTPVVTLSKSGRLKQIETLGDLIEEKEQLHELKSGHEHLLKPTTADQVEAVKEKLEGFTHSPEHETATVDVNASPKLATSKPGSNSPLFKEGKAAALAGGKNVAGKKTSISDDDSSSGEDLSDSDSDSEFEIFPPVDPAKMKLHPPVKLDILQLEKKLGTSLSRAATPPKGEITEVQ